MSNQNDNISSLLLVEKVLNDILTIVCFKKLLKIQKHFNFQKTTQKSINGCFCIITKFNGILNIH